MPSFEFDDESREVIKTAFDIFDTNGTGLIEADELADVLRAAGLNPSKADVEGVMKALNVKDGGGVTFEQYLEFLQSMVGKIRHDLDSGSGPEQKMREAFRRFDKDGSGFLERDEFRRVLTMMGQDRLTDEQFEEVMRDVDTDHDGRINIDEFIRMTLQGLQWALK